MEYYNLCEKRYVDALEQGSGYYKIRVELLSDDETAIGEITQDLSFDSQGQITINYDGIVRRSCSLTLIDVEGKYLPRKNSPFWINRKFKLYIGLAVGDDIYWFSQGVYYTLSATSTEHALSIEGVDKGGALDGTLKLNMTDYNILIERGDNVNNVVRTILAMNMNSVPLMNNGMIYSNDKPIDVASPIIDIDYYGQTLMNQIQIDSNNYPSEILTQLANSYGAECYYDTDGHFIFARYIESEGYQYVPKIWNFNELSSFFEDANYNYTYDGENTVTYYTNSSDAETNNVAWTAYNTNALSPLCVTTGIRRAPSQEITYYRYYGKEEIEECRSVIKEIQDEILANNIDTSVTVYGNIDMNNRHILEWTEGSITAYNSELLSWGYTPSELKGTVSTVMGTSSEYDGVEIAFSPMLQTTDNVVLLGSDLVDEYIWGLLDNLGSGWTKEQLIAADAVGLEFSGVLIKGLIADAGETAIRTGEIMHYVGDYGALTMAKNELAETEAYYDELNQKQMIADCRSAANHYLIAHSLIGMQLSFNCPIIPHIDVNKAIGISDKRAGIDSGVFIIQSVTIPLSANKMSISATNINWLPNDATFDGEAQVIERS